MPEWLALCDLGAPGWGEPWFPHSAVLLFLTSLVWRFYLWCSAPFCHLLSRHTNPFYNAKPLSLGTVLLGPMSPCNVFGVLVAVLSVLGVCFALVALFGFCWFLSFFVLHRDGLMDCVLVLVQHCFAAHLLNKMEKFRCVN